MDTIAEMMQLMRAARVLANFSQEELARQAGISRQMLVRIEKNQAKGVPVEALRLVRSALEAAGIEFIPSTDSRGPGIALRRSK
jgi:transcriptional regulator with XRE-family HTH domain